MTPSLTAADSAVYKRPLLYDELASKTGAAEYPEDNERWVVFYGPNTTKTVSPEACSKGYFRPLSNWILCTANTRTER